MGDSLGGASLVGQGHAQIIMGFCIGRLEAERFCIVVHSLLDVALVHENTSQIIMRLGVCRPEAERLGIVVDGLGEALLPFQDRTQISVGYRTMRIDCQGVLE